MGGHYDEKTGLIVFKFFGGPWCGAEMMADGPIVHLDGHKDGHYHWCEKHDRYEWHQVGNEHGE